MANFDLLNFSFLVFVSIISNGYSLAEKVSFEKLIEKQIEERRSGEKLFSKEDGQYWNLYEGDMLLSDEQKEAFFFGKKSGIAYGARPSTLWPSSRDGKTYVPYKIDISIGSAGTQAIKRDIEDYHRHTCIRFIPRTSQRNYILFYDGTGCHSPVGMNPHGPNRVSLKQPDCQPKGVALHEIGHSLGFFHEQDRPDRDKYIRIEYDNIPKKFWHVFDIGMGIDTMGTKYDFDSLMHYTAYGFVKRAGLKSITTVDPRNQRKLEHGKTHFSPTDIQELNILYCGKPRIPTPTGGDQSLYCSLFAKMGACTDPVERYEVVRKCPEACKEYTNPNKKRLSCGGHRANSCEECPQGHGAYWCNGDCFWKGNECIMKDETKRVVCGGHRADSCSKCPAGHGPGWCHGWCHWRGNKCRIDWGN